MIKIRQATQEDLEQILPLQEDIANKLNIPFDYDYAREQGADIIADLQSVVLVADKEGEVLGVIVGSWAPALCSPLVTTMQEYCWNVKGDNPRIALQLLKSLEKMADSMELELRVASPTWNKSLDRWLSRHGYTEVETHYVRK